MSRNNFDEGWERCKGYLIRSQFQDVPLLSPVSEEEESLDSRSRTLRSPIFRPRKPSRPESPLPPLIIEKEQRPNRHDDPEEFYTELEQKLLKIYKNLFVEGEGNKSSCGATDIEDVDVETMLMDSTAGVSIHSEKRNSFAAIDDGFNDNLDGCHELDKAAENNNNDRSNPKRPFTENNDDNEASNSKISKRTVSRSSSEASPKSTSSDDTEEISSSLNSSLTDASEDNETETGVSSLSNYGEDVRVVTFQADVHRDAPDYEFVRPPSVAYKCAANLEKAVEDLEDNNGLAILENNTVSDHQRLNTSDQTEIIDEIEAMRAEPIRPSVISLHNQDHTASFDDNHVMNEESRHLEEPTDSTSHEGTMEFDSLHRRSPPIENNNSEDSEDNVFKMFRRNSFSSSSASSSICYANAQTQTSLDYESVSREDLRDIFVGTPKVFRLFSPADHSSNR